ncbi:MAG: hypothetical protein LN568_02240 [Rickettsia endosymbiont of Pseudomimeciton antennatum]|nr:hypothetical protein [Rickettsia endosymbiont of Pseudomimeciton antennatum]
MKNGEAYSSVALSDVKYLILSSVFSKPCCSSNFDAKTGLLEELRFCNQFSELFISISLRVVWRVFLSCNLKSSSIKNNCGP